MTNQRLGLLYRYQQRLPAIDYPLSLGEGNTPLLRLHNLPKIFGFDDSCQLWVKFEGVNPTGSFKDRGMVVAVADAKKKGTQAIICASTGNTSASAAAYASRCNLACIVLIPSGKVASGKLAQAVAYNATILQVDGNFDDAMQVVNQLSNDGQISVVNSINPMRIQGQKTIAFEVIEQLNDAPDYHALPVGNAGNITAHWLGYCEATGNASKACSHCLGNCSFINQPRLTDKKPVMIGYQASQSAPFINGCPINQPETIASAIRIGNPQSFESAKIAVIESGGWFGAVSDEDILTTQRLLASKEGIFCEPASATSVAGIINDIKSARLPMKARIVCTLTGNGLKDPDIFPLTNIRPLPIKDLSFAIKHHIEKS